VPVAALQVGRAVGLAAIGLAALGVAGCGSSGSSGPSPSTTTHAAGHRARQAQAGAAAGALVAPAHPAARSVRVPILTYHRVHAYATELTKSIPDLTVEPGTFYAEMTALKDAGYHSISIRQLFDALFGGAALPSRPVLISVDDGYVDDVKTILPALRQLGLRATFFVITGRFAEPGFVNQDQVRQLAAAGMDVADHTLSHVDLRTQSPDALTAQVAGSRRTLESVLGHPVAAFAYPFGTFNDAVVAQVRRAGFALAMTTQGGTTASAQAPLTIPRIHVGRAETPSGLLSVLGGSASAPSGGAGG